MQNFIVFIYHVHIMLIFFPRSQMIEENRQLVTDELVEIEN
jgi:hypothetical protein